MATGVHPANSGGSALMVESRLSRTVQYLLQSSSWASVIPTSCVPFLLHCYSLLPYDTRLHTVSFFVANVFFPIVEISQVVQAAYYLGSEIIVRGGPFQRVVWSLSLAWQGSREAVWKTRTAMHEQYSLLSRRPACWWQVLNSCPQRGVWTGQKPSISISIVRRVWLLTMERHRAVASPQLPRGPPAIAPTPISQITMCSMQHGLLYITNVVDFCKIYSPSRLAALLHGFPTLACPELTSPPTRLHYGKIISMWCDTT